MRASRALLNPRSTYSPDGRLFQVSRRRLSCDASSSTYLCSSNTPTKPSRMLGELGQPGILEQASLRRCDFQDGDWDQAQGWHHSGCGEARDEQATRSWSKQANCDDRPACWNCWSSQAAATYRADLNCRLQLGSWLMDAIWQTERERRLRAIETPIERRYLQRWLRHYTLNGN